MKLLVPIILQLAGVAVIIAEILIPSGGVLAVLAMGIFGYSLYLVFTEVSAVVGASFVVADLIMIPALVILGFKFMARSPLTLRGALSREEGYSSQNPDMEKYIGMTGRALTDLRPAGTAFLNGERTDVVTRGEYLDKGTNIVVKTVTGNQIIVKKHETS